MDSSSTDLRYIVHPGLFLNFVANKLDWGDLAKEIIIEIACGKKEIKLAQLLIERYTDVHVVICLENRVFKDVEDPNQSSRHIEHHWADIEKRNEVSRFEGLADKVLSMHTWHAVEDQAAAFENVFHILRPGGEAAFTFSLLYLYTQWFRELEKNTRWNQYLKDGSVDDPDKIELDEDHYSRLLIEKGFEVVLCKINQILVPVKFDQKRKDKLLKMASLKFSIPSELETEFQSYIFETFMTTLKDEDGRPCEISKYITAIVKKPLQ